MQAAAPPSSSGHEFYRSAIEVLRAASIEFLVGGAFALRVHTGVRRDTKDIDLLVRPKDVELTLEVLRKAGFRVEMTFSHWLAKVWHEDHFIDVIFRSGNGLCDVDDEWFEFAQEAEVLGIPLLVCPAEEMIWQKAYIMERERFDGADVQHLLLNRGQKMNWERLLRRFGPDGLVLLSHLVLFAFVFPGEQACVPQWVMETLVSQFRSVDVFASGRLCRGTLLSRLQYLNDVEIGGYTDARLGPNVEMKPQEILQWTAAAREQEAAGRHQARKAETPES